MQLHHVFILQHVIAAHGLTVELAAAPDARGLQLLLKVVVNATGEYRHR